MKRNNLFKTAILGITCLLGIGGFSITQASNNLSAKEADAATYHEIHFWPVNQGSSGIGSEGIWNWGGSYVKVPETSKIKLNSSGAMFSFTIYDEDMNKNNISSFEFNIKLHNQMHLTVKRGFDDIFYDKDITADNTWVKMGKTKITGTGAFNFVITNNKNAISDEIYFETPNLRAYSVVEYPVYIAKGTGVSNVFLSTSSSATSGSSSGTNFEDGQTVYGFATLASGYSAPSGWSKVSGSTYRIGSKTISGGSADFGTANATAVKYTISYNLNGGTVSTANPTQYYVTTNDFTLNNPTKTGYTFTGWSGTGISGTSTSVKVSKGSTGNRSYTANWSANKYTVKYNANKPTNATGSVSNMPSNQTWTYDSDATLPAAPTLTGWTFGGWYKDAACTDKLGNAGQKLTKPNLRTTSGDVILYASWTANTYTAKYNGNKPTKAPSSYEVTGIPASETWTYDGTTAVTLGDAPELTGYVFDGWYKDAACTDKLGNAGQSISKPNINSTKGGTGNIYAKWIFNADVQAVINEINKTKTVSYDDLTGQINIADTAYNDLDPLYQAVVDSEGYTKILNNAKAADEVGQMIEDLGEAQDTEEWRSEVETVRAAYNALLDKSFIPASTILKILVDDEAAIEVMDAINEIGETRWTPTSKALIDDAQEAYDDYIDGGHPHDQVANYDVLVQAHTDYNNVQTFVDKVNAITLNPFEYTSTCKGLIDEARRYFEEDLSDYQQGLGTSDAATYYNLLVNYENAYHAMYLIDQINDMVDDPSCGAKIEAARNAVDDLNKTTELPLVNSTLMKELTDKEAAWEVIELINAIYPMVYGPECEQAIETARDAYNALNSDQQPLVVNYAELTKAEADYILVKAVVTQVNNLGDIRYDEASLDKIEDARNTYELLTDDQKGFFPEDSLQTIVDYETAYEALDKIYNIGDVSYDTESEGKINDSRDFYDNLSEEQKALIHEDDLAVLTTAEDEYSHLKTVATILVIIFLIVACLAILGGIWFLFFLLKRRRDDDDDDNNKKGQMKDKLVKVRSMGGLSLLVILTSHYLDAQFIALYVLALVAILVWVACLIVAILKRKHRKLNQKTASSNNEEEEEVVTVTDEKGNIFQIRFIKSFTAKLIQSPQESKNYYEELKNEVLSYKGTTSRISWHYDSINYGRDQVLKFAVRGKTLCVYYPLNAEEYEQSKYKVEKVESKKFEEVPCLYRIKNDRRLGYAKELIKVVMDKLGLEKGEEQHEKYANLAYEENKPLIERGLIKELKVQINKPKEEVVLDSKVSADGDEIITTQDKDGNIFEIRFVKSFTAKLSQSSDELKNYYNELKNYTLSYKDVHSRVSWHHDAVNLGRDYLIKFAIRGKTLCLFYALDSATLDGKYKVEEAKGRRFIDVPCLYRIKNDKRLAYAKELIDLVMKKYKVNKGNELSDEYRIPYETTEVLLAKGLIKEVKTKINRPTTDTSLHSITVEEADKLMSDEKAEASLEEDTIHHHQKGQKEIVNIDTLSQNYNDGDTVDLASLKEKKLVPSKTGYVKVLARGKLDKKLIVDLDDFSIQAVKMIVLLGGHAKKIK